MKTPNIPDSTAFMKMIHRIYVDGDGYDDSTPIDICNIHCLVELVEAYQKERKTSEL